VLEPPRRVRRARTPARAIASWGAQSAAGLAASPGHGWGGPPAGGAGSRPQVPGQWGWARCVREHAQGACLLAWAVRGRGLQACGAGRCGRWRVSSPGISVRSSVCVPRHVSSKKMPSGRTRPAGPARPGPARGLVAQKWGGGSCTGDSAGPGGGSPCGGAGAHAGPGGCSSGGESMGGSGMGAGTGAGTAGSWSGLAMPHRTPAASRRMPANAPTGGPLRRPLGVWICLQPSASVRPAPQAAARRQARSCGLGGESGPARAPDGNPPLWGIGSVAILVFFWRCGHH
jgi:hypothetical protein